MCVGLDGAAHCYFHLNGGDSPEETNDDDAQVGLAGVVDGIHWG